ncbi:nephrin-like isoform X2 [Brevipalpus obovatus]|uniref:nephrin-like isoform X2 n=1 Tax=Brevipalpus obovatus TaxID=246614 RepID=UPI003D9ECD31
MVSDHFVFSLLSSNVIVKNPMDISSGRIKSENSVKNAASDSNFHQHKDNVDNYWKTRKKKKCLVEKMNPITVYDKWTSDERRKIFPTSHQASYCTSFSFCSSIRSFISSKYSPSPSDSDNRWQIIFLVILIISMTCDAKQTDTLYNSNQQQYFLIKPSNVEAIEGDSIKLDCQVGHQIGSIHWYKDGTRIALPDQRSIIPGMPRHSMQIDSNLGINSLRISGLKIEDEGDYQCRIESIINQESLRASSKVSIIVPPKQLTIAGFWSSGNSSAIFTLHSTSSPSNHMIEVHGGERVTLICSTSLSKPPPRVKWFRKNTELLPEASRTYYNKSIVNNRHILYSMESSIILYPKTEEHYSCEVHHNGLVKPLRAFSVINILSEPGLPVIEGYKEEDPVIEGSQVNLNCVSRGGYPPPKLLWYRNGIEVDKSYQMNSKNEAVNNYSFTTTIDDNQSVLKCSASNGLSRKPTEISIKLNIFYLPSKVTITGPTEVRLYQTIVLKCVTRPGNPAPRLVWLVEDNVTQASTMNTESDGNNAWIVTSTLNFAITSRIPVTRTFTCKTDGFPTGDSVSDQHKVTVIYAPNPPTLTGYKSNFPIQAGSLQRIKCTSSGGNPPPDIKWFKSGIEISTVTSVTGSGVSSELVIRPEFIDNGIEYKCSVNSPALSSPYTVTVKLNVIYPPQRASIKISPTEPQENQLVNIECKSGPSNPSAEIEWRESEIRIDSVGTEIVANKENDGRENGFWTRSWYKLNVSSDHDGMMITCIARNNMTAGPGIRDNHILKILHKPEFLSDGMNFTMIEGENKILNISIRSNPKPDRYLWKKFSQQNTTSPGDSEMEILPQNNIKIDGPQVFFTNVSRNSSGKYSLVASNKLGSSKTWLFVDVQYAPSISGPIELRTSSKSASNWPKEGDPFFQLHCPISSNPEPTVKWMKENDANPMDWFRMKVDMIHSDHVYWSIMTIHNVTRHDAGLYSCATSNSISVQNFARSIRIHIEYRPTIRKHFGSKVATDADGRESARLVCLAVGYPNVQFDWNLGSQRNPSRFKMVNLVNYTNGREAYELFRSDLIISQVTKSDFDRYRCRAYNHLGEDTFDINLVSKGIPDPPSNLTVVNITHDSITIHWEPGFDGGSEQSFRVMYKNFAEPELASSDSIDDIFDIGPVYNQQQDASASITSQSSSESLFQKSRGNISSIFVPNGNKLITISNLESYSDYIIAVTSRNQIGESRLTADPLRARTSMAPIEISRSNSASASSASDAQLSGNGSSSSINLFDMNISLMIVGSLISITFLALLSIGLVCRNRGQLCSSKRGQSNPSDSSGSTGARGGGDGGSGGGGPCDGVGNVVGGNCSLITTSSGTATGTGTGSDSGQSALSIDYQHQHHNQNHHQQQQQQLDPNQHHVHLGQSVHHGQYYGHHHRQTAIPTTIDDFVRSSPPYIIATDAVAPSCKFEPISMLTVASSKHSHHHQIAECDSKCYMLQSDKLMNTYLDENDIQMRMRQSPDSFHYHTQLPMNNHGMQSHQPDILITRLKDDMMMNDSATVCCENGLQLMEHGIGLMNCSTLDTGYDDASNSLTTNATIRRISRVNIIDGEYTLTTVPEEECEEIL